MKKLLSSFVFLALVAITGFNTTAAYASGDGNATPPVPQVDVKINGLDGPLTIEEDTILDVSWNSKGARECIISGSYMPLVNPFMPPAYALLTSDIRSLPVSGNFKVYARNVMPDVRQLYVVIQCYGPYYPVGEVGEGRSQSDYAKDTVIVDLVDPVIALRSELIDTKAQRDNTSNDLASLVIERDQLTNDKQSLQSLIDEYDRAFNLSVNDNNRLRDTLKLSIIASVIVIIALITLIIILVKQRKSPKMMNESPKNTGFLRRS